MIQFAEVAIGQGGGPACVRCAQAVSPRMRDLTDIAADLNTCAANWTAGPGPNVAFVGAEPFAHPQLPHLVDAARRAGFERIRLHTDAGALAQAANAEGVVQAGIRHLEVVLLGASVETHDRLAGRPGLFEAALAGTRAFTAAAAMAGAEIFVSVDVPVCRHNVGELALASAAAARLGASAVTFSVAGLSERPGAFRAARRRPGDGDREPSRRAGARLVACDTQGLRSRAHRRPGGGGAVSRRLGVSLVGVSAPGYRSLALDYLHAAVAADPRLDVAINRLDTDTTQDPWWLAYRLLSLEPAPDVIALPVYCWTARQVFEAIRLVKSELPGVLVVVGGPEVGPIAEEVLASHPAIDAVVRGEGEFALAELLHSHARGGDVASVPGVTARADGAIVSAPDRAAISNLDDIPSAFSIGRPIATDGSAYVETYRGCPHACAYCYEGKGSTRIRSFSWDRIAADIEAVATAPGMRSFSFIDPVFNLTPDRLARLSEILAPHARRGVRLHTIEVDIERIDDEQAALLAAAGVASVETGPQSVGAAALAACGRAFDAERFAAGVRACRRAGISVECDLIVGLSGDRVDDVVAGLDFAIGLDPGRVQISTLHVLPGTSLWERADELGLRFDREPPHEIISTPDLSYADLRRLEVLGNAATQAYRARLSIAPRST